MGSTQDAATKYLLTTEATSLSDAITRFITPDNVSSNPSTLFFDNYVLAEDEQIKISKSLNISGSISSTNENAIFDITSGSDCTVTFVNAIITNNNFDKLINISSTKNITLKLDSVTFNTTKTNSYAINATPTTNVVLAGELTHTTTYLFEYKSGLTLDLTDNTLTTNTPVKIALDYQFDNTVIATDIHAPNNNHINFVATKDFYVTHKTFDQSNNILSVRTSLNVEYLLDGGDLNGYTPSNIYIKENFDVINLPTASNISKDYAIFDGWFGKITITEEQKTANSLSATTYYFDVTAVGRYIENGATIADFDTYFKTDLTEFEIDSSIISYLYTEPTSETNYWANFFISLETRPTLVAKWNPILYTITFNSNGGELIDPISEPFGTTLTTPIPTKTGYTFTNWYRDEQLTTVYTFSTMADENITLYAEYQINQYTITFKTNNGEADQTTTQNYAEEINFPTISKTGHSLEGWYTDSTLNTKYTQTTIPAESISLFAKWTINTYNITLSTDGKVALPQIQTLYNEIPTPPADPIATGYLFHGWFTDKTFTTPFDFTTPTPASNRIAYAKWTVMQFNLTLVYNNGVANFVSSKDFESNITTPAQPVKAGFLFAGWYTDSTFTTKFDFEGATMPASNLTLYANWTEKITIVLNLEKQTIEAESRTLYKVPSMLSGFIVYYNVNNTWQTEAPTEIGSYDIKIVRAEDSQYKKYESQVIEDGFTITPKTLDLSWLPLTMLIVFVIEMCMVIVVKLLRKKKLTQTIVVQTIALPFGLIPKTQFILSIVTGALALFGFIYLIVELVKLHRTVPLKDEVDTRYDNRALLEKRGDKSEDASISSNVSNLLKKEGLYTYDYSKDDNYKVDENIIDRADASYTGKKPIEDDFDPDFDIVEESEEEPKDNE